MDKKLSETPAGTLSEFLESSKFLFLDEADTSHAQAGPEGTWKQGEASWIRNFGSIKGAPKFLSLAGIDTSGPVIPYIKSAIDSTGPYSVEPGEEFRFYTVQQTSSTGGSLGTNAILTYYKIVSGVLEAGVGKTAVPVADIIVDGGPLRIDSTSDPDLFIDLGEFSGSVTDHFNEGDPDNSDAAWNIEYDILIKGVQDGVDKLWFWNGGVGQFGGVLAPDPPTIELAVDADFIDLSGQGTLPTPDLEYIPLAFGDETSAAAVSASALHVRWAYPFRVVDFWIYTTDAVTGSDFIMDLKKNGTTMLSVKPRILDGEKSSYTTDDVAATGLLTLTGNLSDGDTVTIGTRVYVFEDTLTNSNGNVKIGATQADTVNNFVAALGLTGTAGTDYAAAMTINNDVTGVNSSDNLSVTSKKKGVSGNSVASTETSSTASWGGATLSGGVDQKIQFSVTDVAANDEIDFAIDQVGSTNAGTGPKGWLVGYKI